MEIARLDRGVRSKRRRERGVGEAAFAPLFLRRRQAAAFLVLIRFAKNLKDGDRAFNSVEGRKIVTMLYYDQLIQCTAVSHNY